MSVTSKPVFQLIAGLLIGLAAIAAAGGICFFLGLFFVYGFSEHHPSSRAASALWGINAFVPVMLLVSLLIWYLRKPRTAFINGMIISLSRGILGTSCCGIYLVAS
jgi:hypothetical protein